MESLHVLLDNCIGKAAYLKIAGLNEIAVTILAVRPPSQLPAASDPNALIIAIEASHFTVTDGHVTREVLGRNLVMKSIPGQ